LTIPHPRLAQRRFVLVPLAELRPRLRHPVSQRTVRQMLNQTADRSEVVKLEKIMNPIENS
jgi:2-amino-4-hydroxy-6-hydroxymethyldihydropteridine diphosphokinase